MRSEIPKQFLPLSGRPMLAYSLEALALCPDVKTVVVVLPAGRPVWVDAELTSAKIWNVVEGGSTRQASLDRAIAAIPPYSDAVAVHDAARPLLASDHLSTLLLALDDSCEGVIPAIPLEDSIKAVSEQAEIVETPSREGIWRAQTPQVFHRGPLEEGLARAVREGHESSDCSELLTRVGYRVRVVRGDAFNLKVTTEPDLRLAEFILRSRGAAPVPERPRA